MFGRLNFGSYVTIFGLLTCALGVWVGRFSVDFVRAQSQELLNIATDPLPNGGLFIFGEPIRLYTSSNPSWVRYRLTDAYGDADWTVNGAVYEGEGTIVPAQPGGKWLILPTDALTRYGLYRLDITTNVGEVSDLRIGLVDPIVRLGEHNSSSLGFIIVIDSYSDFAAQLGLLGIKWVHFDIPVDSATAVGYALTAEVRDFVDRALAQDVTFSLPKPSLAAN